MDGSISVAIPVFNRAEWIGQTLEHIFNQTVPVDEVVLCDDGSTDDLLEVLKPFQGRIRLISIENSGPAIARKVAIENCSGNWVALCDSDDFWDSEHLGNFLKALSEFPDLDLYFSNFRLSDNLHLSKFEQAPDQWFEKLTVPAYHRKSCYRLCKEPFLSALLDFQACFQSCMIFRKDFYYDVGGIKNYVSRWRSEDFHLTARMAAEGKGVTCSFPDVLINKHDENFSGDYVKTLKGELDVLKDLRFNNFLPSESLGAVDAKINNYYLRLFRACYWAGDYVGAVEFSHKVPFESYKSRDVVRLIVSRFFVLFQSR